MKSSNASRFALLALGALVLCAPVTDAFERYNDGCQDCHGAFTGGTSPKGSVFPNNDKHRMHRSSQSMNTDCDLCHSTGDGDDPFIAFSDGTASNPGLGCVGCHETTGLRLHHTTAGVTDCEDCHSGDPTPPPENTVPPYYGTVDTNADVPCNDVQQANLNENWTVGDFLGLDNDGDGLYDAVDPDCATSVCGNGVLETGEDCDDGNTADGDCCSSTCAFEPSGSTCDDGQFCNVNEACDGAGSCTGGVQRDCGDGVSCTVDTCDEAGDTCVNTPDDAICDDGVFCNGTETCSATLDCQAGTPVDCDDGEICTDDSCNEGAGSCDNIFDETNDPSCAITECGNGLVETGEECDDGNTVDGDCCSSTCTFEPSGSNCDDGQYCTEGEVCDGAGTCGNGTARDCDDGVSCTADSCDESGDTCVNTPDDGSCDDGLFCNGTETCHATLDCQAGSPVDCDDGDICTDDACNEQTDACDNVFDPTNDPTCQALCTDDDMDGYSTVGGTCGPIDCDDTDPRVNPGADEDCDDDKDNDCNGLVDAADPACDGAGDGWNVRSGPLDAAGYAGSEACADCHEHRFDDWIGSLHARILIRPGDAQAAGFPLPPNNPAGGVTIQDWSDVLFVVGQKWRTLYVDRSGLVQGSQWNYLNAGWTNQNGAQTAPYDCGACHTTGFDPDAEFLDDQGRPVPNIVGSWAEYNIGCEACHGPGAEHVANPSSGNINRITFDWYDPDQDGTPDPVNVRSSVICGNCHYRGDRDVVQRLQQNHEQYNDWAASGHASSLELTAINTYCAKCHSPGNADYYAAEHNFTNFPYSDATHNACISCHDPHNASRPRWSDLGFPAGGQQDPRDEPAAIARYRGTDGNPETRDHDAFASDDTSGLCADCHRRIVGFRRHRDASPAEEVRLETPFSAGQPVFVVPHREHVEAGNAECVDCHMHYSRQSMNRWDVRTHTLKPNEWEFQRSLPHYSDTCGPCHARAEDCDWCHTDWAPAVPGSEDPPETPGAAPDRPRVGNPMRR
jgi:cysteine-rich repeat protein